MAAGQALFDKTPFQQLSVQLGNCCFDQVPLKVRVFHKKFKEVGQTSHTYSKLWLLRENLVEYPLRHKDKMLQHCRRHNGPKAFA